MLPNRKSFYLVLVLVEVTVLLVEEEVVARFFCGWRCCHVRFDLVLIVFFINGELISNDVIIGYNV